MNPERHKLVMQTIDLIIDRPDKRDQILSEVCNGDHSLRSEVEDLLAQQTAVVGFLEESPVDALVQQREVNSMIGRRIGPYRIVDEIGRGGMGAVYKAVRDDDEYKTEVAIKLIKRGMDTDYILRRFRNERQILANLNHPNIARLLDGGTTNEGLPYFVMECIEGRAIDEYCQEKELSLTERLVLFRSVCTAVNYAHQNLIIHRDLKPSNILITKEGAPKLLDFGIAKLLQDEADESPTALTITEVLALTPDYASPEQVSSGTITTVSDVYSLGVVLYELLTGHRPYRLKNKTPDEIARVICEQAPARPSRAVNHNSLNGDLDAIVMMALRKEPDRRYSSVAQFSEDIHRYLAGLPVIAHRDSLAYRTTKFIRRHRTSVIAGSIIALVLVGGVTGTAWEAHIARRERARAERRFNDVRKLADSFMFELNDEIVKEPTKARELLVTRALEYLDRLAQEASDDLSLQRELATAYQKVGDVQSELHGPNIGNSQGATESYRKSLTLREQSWAKAPNDIEIGIELATSHNRMGDILSKTGVADEALTHYRKALEIISELQNIAPKNVALRRLQSQTHVVLGRALLKTSSLREVLDNFGNAVTIREALLAEDPTNRELQRELPTAYESLGYALTEKGDVLGALELYRKSLAINESLLATDPANAKLRRSLFDSNWWVGVALGEAGKPGESINYHRKALAIAQQLSSIDPTNIQARNDLADAHMELANSLTLNNSANEALENYRRAIENYEFVWAADKRNAHARRQVFYTHLHMGEAQTRARDVKGALETFRRAVAAFEELSLADPANTEIQNDLAVGYRELGEVFLLMHDSARAMTQFNQALPIFEKLSKQSPLNVRTKRNLALTCFDLGPLSQKLKGVRESSQPGSLREECSWYQRSIDVWQAMANQTTLTLDDSRKRDEAARQLAHCDATLR